MSPNWSFRPEKCFLNHPCLKRFFFSLYLSQWQIVISDFFRLVTFPVMVETNHFYHKLTKSTDLVIWNDYLIKLPTKDRPLSRLSFWSQNLQGSLSNYFLTFAKNVSKLKITLRIFFLAGTKAVYSVVVMAYINAQSHLDILSWYKQHSLSTGTP